MHTYESTNTPSRNRRDMKTDETNIVTFFQPIFSFSTLSIAGEEALSRGFNADTETFIPPANLFEKARKNGTLTELDRSCHYEALRSFTGNQLSGNRRLLFLNLEIENLTDDISELHYLSDLTIMFNLPPENIVIEFLESQIGDEHRLVRTVEYLRGKGFMLALDDIGMGHSNLHRIALLKPDIIKIDKSLITGIENDIYQQEIFRALVQLAHRTGALTIAEGIETTDEAITCIDLGADLMQGFLFARPDRRIHSAGEAGLAQIRKTRVRYNQIHHIRQNLIKKRNRKYRKTASQLAAYISNCPVDQVDEELRHRIVRYSEVECVFVLDTKGIQISRTVSNFRGAYNAHPIFRPASVGTDHSMKRYYLEMTHDKRYVITEPYISQATGSRCITITTRLKLQDNYNGIVCIDMLVD